MRIILASSSPRRKELLKLLVPEFEILVSGIEEKLEDGLSMQDQVIRLFYMKAKAVYEKTSGNRIIIACDTMVTKKRKIYGKPKDRENAKQMLQKLLEGDKIHSILTGLTVIVDKDGEYKEYKTFDEVKVFLKNMTELEKENLEKILFEELGSNKEYAETFGDTNVIKAVRNIVGLDKSVASDIFYKYINENRLNMKQIQFVKLLVDYVVKNGTIEMERLTEQPFNTVGQVYELFGNNVDLFKEIREDIEEINENAEKLA